MTQVIVPSLIQTVARAQPSFDINAFEDTYEVTEDSWRSDVLNNWVYGISAQVLAISPAVTEQIFVEEIRVQFSPTGVTGDIKYFTDFKTNPWQFFQEGVKVTNATPVFSVTTVLNAAISAAFPYVIQIKLLYDTKYYSLVNYQLFGNLAATPN